MNENLPAPVPPDDFSVRLTAFGDALSEAARCFIDLFRPFFDTIGRAFTEVWNALMTPAPRRRGRHRPRNTRVQMVQAKRKHLNLDQHGLYPALRSRKASYAYAQAVERWCEGKQDSPRLRDFERVPARRRRKEARRFTGGIVNYAGWILVNEDSHKELVPDQVDATRYAVSVLAAPARASNDLSTPVDNHQREVHHG